MTKKVLISITLFFVMIFVATFVSANNDELNNAGHAVTNVVTDAGRAVKNGAENIGNSLQRGAQGITGAITGNNNNDNNDDNRDTMFSTDDNNRDYTVTRTNTNAGTIMGMSPTTWTWFTLAVAGILIIALVWYYASQNNKINNYEND